MNSLEIRQFNLREASWVQDKNVLSNLRRLVFIVEQKVPQEEEWDGQDEDAWHWLATDNEDRPIGTARLLRSGQIGRMAVLDNYRGLKVGQAMLEHAVEKARRLGFTDVYLNAQSHALGFYVKAGFASVGEEFMEAGIAHFRMEQKLPPLDDRQQRKLISGDAPAVVIRDYDTAEVEWTLARKLIRSLRKSVLVAELGLPDSTMEDEDDPRQLHFQSQSNRQTIGAIRMDLEGHISRLAVDSEFRGKGVGNALVEAATAKARRFGLKSVQVDGPVELDNFYRQAGFLPKELPKGAPLTESKLQHQSYVRLLDYSDTFKPTRTSQAGVAYADEDSAYVLGETAAFLLLRREEEFRRVILAMCRQATQSIRILSPMLDHKLFDSVELLENFSALARRNKYTHIEILLYDSHRVVKNGHALLEIARRLPSSIGIRIVHPELRNSNYEFVLADGAGVIYRQDYESYEGSANFKDVTECNRLNRQFQRAWESGLQDPNLRQLKI
ncbi:MAG: putative GNAT family N-acyltransferase [Candidatus Azotimanducaceae bacterium]|jgi:predicted GNAT family N-acyltransferase